MPMSLMCCVHVHSGRPGAQWRDGREAVLDVAEAAQRPEEVQSRDQTCGLSGFWFCFESAVTWILFLYLYGGVFQSCDREEGCLCVPQQEYL